MSSGSAVLYLASQSQRRREILKQMKIRFRVVPSRYHEKPKRLKPHALALAHAEGKAAQAVLPKSARRGIVLGADTIVVVKGKILGKPRGKSGARRMLRLLSGKSHTVITAIALRNLSTGEMISSAEETSVKIRKLSAAAIYDYPEKVHTLDKAGAYAIQLKPAIVSKISGSYSNVVGLPKELLRRLLRYFS